MLPKVSIIIPVYNVEFYIEDCLQSVMRQSYEGSIECILVDDCGTDHSMEVAGQLIEAYNGSIDFKVLHHEHNRGLSAARNTGIEASSGEYVFFLDSDDWISDDCIERLTQPLDLEQYDFVIGHYVRDGKDYVVTCPEGQYYSNDWKLSVRCRIPVSACNKLFRKSFLLDHQLRFEEGKVYEDSVFSFDLACAGGKYYVISNITYYYRRRENSITTRENKYRIADYIDLFHTMRNRFRQGKCIYLDGIYDYYMYWVWRIFRMISGVEMDETMLNYVQKETQGFLEVVPNMRCLSNKHNRLVYFFCRKDQTYSRFQYVSQQYSAKLSGRIIRNLLNLIPSKKVEP